MAKLSKDAAEQLKPYIKRIYMDLQGDMDISDDIVSRMDDNKTVRSFNMETLGKKTPSPIETAREIAKEREVERNAEVTRKGELTEIKPIGHGILGDIYGQFKGKAKEAIAFLRGKRSGVAEAALHHSQVGDIDLAWGDEKYGLEHILLKHPAEANHLQELLDEMNVIERSDNRIVLESDTHRAVVSKMKGDTPTPQWLLTAYKRKEKSVSASSSDIETEPKGKRNGTATPQSGLSSGKDMAKSANGKTKAEKTKEQDLFSAIEKEENPTPQKPKEELTGNSEEYQRKAIQEKDFVNEIAKAIYATQEATPLTMNEVKKLAAKYDTLEGISTTDLQEMVEVAMTNLTRTVALQARGKDAETQRAGYDKVVSLYNAQPLLNARDSTRVERQQYSTPTPFGYVMGLFVRAGRDVKSVLEPSAGNGALTIAFNPKIVHVNDIDERRLANLRTLGYGKVTNQNALLPFEGEAVDALLTNPPFGTTTEQEFDNGTFKISSLEGLMAINGLEAMKDDGRAAIVIGGNTEYRENGVMKPKDMKFWLM